jgi:hypothetical protein
MKSSDMRAKARAIFGSAIAEPMPNQPNGAKALQQRANARPIPTYKVGGVVKKAGGGNVSGRSAEADDVLASTPRGRQMMEEQRRREAAKSKADAAKRAAADKLLGIGKYKEGSKSGKSTYLPPVPPQEGYRRGFEPRPGESDEERLKREVEELKRRARGRASGGNYDHYNNAEGGKIQKKAEGGLLDRVGRFLSDMANEEDRDRYGRPMNSVNRSQRTSSTNSSDRMERNSSATKTQAVKPLTTGTKTARLPEDEKKYVRLNEKPQYVRLNEKRKYVKLDPSVMKKGGAVKSKPKTGLAVMIAIGKPIKEKATGEMYPSKKAMAKHEAAESAGMERKERMMKPVKRAVGGAGKTRKGMC